MFWCKNFEFFEVYGVFARTGGLSHCGQSVRGQFFTILYERPFLPLTANLNLFYQLNFKHETKTDGLANMLVLGAIIWASV